jgi:hypothetical protein
MSSYKFISTGQTATGPNMIEATGGIKQAINGYTF